MRSNDRMSDSRTLGDKGEADRLQAGSQAKAISMRNPSIATWFVPVNRESPLGAHCPPRCRELRPVGRDASPNRPGDTRSSNADDARIAIVTAYAQFLDDYPAYPATSALDELRASEYGRLDSQGHVYLDYTGGALHADSSREERWTSHAQSFVAGNHSMATSRRRPWIRVTSR